MQRRRKKSYDISLNREEKYILVHLYGELTKADIDAALEDILTIRQQENLMNILCNQRQLRTPPNMKLAIVRARMPEKIHFFETVATNRARAVKVFNNDEEAKKWLAL